MYGVLVYRLVPPDYPIEPGGVLDFGCEYEGDGLPAVGEVITVRVLSDGEPYYEIRAEVTQVSESDDYPIAADEIAGDSEGS